MYKMAIAALCILQTSVWAKAVEASEYVAKAVPGITLTGIKDVSLSGKKLYVITRDMVYELSLDGGCTVTFEEPSSGKLGCMTCSDGAVLVGGENGLWMRDRNGSWKRIFWSLFEDKREVVRIDVSSYPGVVIATRSGIFRTDDVGGAWRDITNNLKGRVIRGLCCGEGSMFAAADNGIYLFDRSRTSWTRVRVGQGAPADDQDPGVETDDAVDGKAAPACLYSSSGALVAACDGSLYESLGAGRGWKELSRVGMSGEVVSVAYDAKSGRTVAATSSGLFVRPDAGSGWREIPFDGGRCGTLLKVVYDAGARKFIVASTDAIYTCEMRPSEDADGPAGDVVRRAVVAGGHEPAYKELRAAAIAYADVSDDKTKRWKTLARLKALAPKISCNFDRSSSSNAEIYTSATRDYVAVGPDDIDSGYGVTLTWELSDIVWSQEEATAIDARSRYTTQLRNDILEELRRLYFDRERLKLDIRETLGRGEPVSGDKKMRFEELTEAIDDLTDGCLTGNRNGVVA